MTRRADPDIERAINELALLDPAAADRIAALHGYHFASEAEDAALEAGIPLDEVEPLTLTAAANADSARAAFDAIFGTGGTSK